MAATVLLSILVFAAIAATGCTSAPKEMVKANDTIKIMYTRMLPGGEIIDSTNGTPYEFTLGQNVVAPGVEKAVLGMSPGEKKQVNLTPEEAYGPYRVDLVADLPKTGPLANPDIKPGEIYQYTLDSGQTGYVKVIRISDSSVTVDSNHILAGKNVLFDIEVVEIVKKN